MAPPTCRASWWGWRRSWGSSWGTRSCRCPSGWRYRFSLDPDLKTGDWRHTEDTVWHHRTPIKQSLSQPSFFVFDLTCRSATRTSGFLETNSLQTHRGLCWGWSPEPRTPASRRTSTSSYRNQSSWQNQSPPRKRIDRFNTLHNISYFLMGHGKLEPGLKYWSLKGQCP